MSCVFIRAGSQNSPSRANAILWCALTSHNVESSIILNKNVLCINWNVDHLIYVYFIS